MPIRQALGVRTVFNILGPLSNPVAPLFDADSPGDVIDPRVG